MANYILRSSLQVYKECLCLTSLFKPSLTFRIEWKSNIEVKSHRALGKEHRRDMWPATPAPVVTKKFQEEVDFCKHWTVRLQIVVMARCHRSHLAI